MCIMAFNFVSSVDIWYVCLLRTTVAQNELKYAQIWGFTNTYIFMVHTPNIPQYALIHTVETVLGPTNIHCCTYYSLLLGVLQKK